MSDLPSPADPPAATAPAARVLPVRPRPPRLPGTCATSFERDMNWRHGVAFLWVFFVLTAVGQAVLAAFLLMRGSEYSLPWGVCVDGAMFLALWLGWGWLRWPLAATNFFYGGWLIVWSIANHAAEAAAQASAGAEAPSYGLVSIAQIGFALVYLACAFYLAFSADVLDFLRHRHEEGRGWVVCPVAVLMVACLATLHRAPSIYQRWMEHERASELAFVEQSLATISNQKWNAAAYEERADPAYLKTWYDGDRKDVFSHLSRLGSLWSVDLASAVIGSAYDDTSDGFTLSGQVTLGRVVCARGGTQMVWNAKRTLFGPWKLQGFDAGNPRFDSPPAHAHRDRPPARSQTARALPGRV